MKRRGTRVWLGRGAIAMLLVPLLLWLSGCWLYNVAPVASFTISAQTGQAPLTVNFSAVLSEDEDGEIVKYEWDFGDGTSGTGETVAHTYNEAGTFVIVLRVTDDGGTTATTQKSLYVLPAEPPGPVASFTASPSSGTSPLTVNFNATGSTYEGGTISSYEWDFGDGRAGYGPVLSHTYISAGAQTYTVTLTVRATDGKTGTATKTVSVTVAGGGGTPGANAPSARFVINFDDITQDPVVEYANHDVAPVRVWLDPTDSEAATDRTIATYAWSFGDGNAANSITPDVQEHTFITDLTSKVFSVTLVVIDDEGVTDSITKTVRVKNYQPVAGFEILDAVQAPPVGVGDPNVAPIAGNWEADNVTVNGLAAGDVRAWIRSQQLDDKFDGDWDYQQDTTDPNPNGTNAKPKDYDDHNFSFDPEGQTWSAGAPAWFPNRAWGIKLVRVDWGDGNSDIIGFQDAADTTASHVYAFPGTISTYTIKVTAEDYLGAQATFQRTLTLAP